MKVTVITVCYNRATIEKPSKVSWNNSTKILRYYYWWNSTDGTKAIIETFSDKINLYVSEPDKGTDAIKGVSSWQQEQ
jgi:glycosyltransferase